MRKVFATVKLAFPAWNKTNPVAPDEREIEVTLHSRQATLETGDVVESHYESGLLRMMVAVVMWVDEGVEIGKLVSKFKATTNFVELGKLLSASYNITDSK